VCLFVCTVTVPISLARIKLAASNFARWFIIILGRESHIFGEHFSPRTIKLSVQFIWGLIICVAHALADSFSMHGIVMCG